MSGLALAAVLTAGSARGASPVELKLETSPIVLGQTDSVAVTLHVEEPPGAEERPLRVSVNVGSFGEVTRISQGVYRTLYRCPTTRFPQVALVAIWREIGPEAPIEFARIPLYGATRVPVRTRPRSEVRIRVGAREFGPAVTPRSGSLMMPIDVPPDVAQAELLVKERGGAVATRELPIDVPPYNKLTAALVPHAILANGKQFARIHVLYEGRGVSAGNVRVRPSVGSATFEFVQNGRYVFRYVPPAGTTAQDVRFDVSVDGDDQARAAARLRLGLPPVARVLVTPPAKPVSADGKSTADIRILLLDEAGLGLAAQQVDLTANGVAVTDLRDQGGGVYLARYVAPPRYPAGGLVRFVARAAAAEGNHVEGVANYGLSAAPSAGSLEASLSPRRVPADGLTEATLVLDVRDAAGRPLERAELLAVPSHGRLTPLTEVEAGRYQARYTAPRQPPEGDVTIRLVDPNGGFERTVAVPIREHLGRVQVGLRADYVHSLRTQSGPRAGLDVWMPLRLGAITAGAGLSATGGFTRSKVGEGALSSESEALFAPLTLKAGLEVFATRRGSVTLGVGATAVLARFRTSLTGEVATAVAPGGLGFLTGAMRLGPGEGFLELGYAFAPVRAANFSMDAGGAGVGLGYRMGVY